MKRLLASLASFTRLPLVGVTFLGLSERMSAQAPGDPDPVRNAIVFRMHIYGSGSDPASIVNTAVSQAAQEWTCYREVDGWFEVDVSRRREGSGTAARELVEFSHQPHHRQAMTGVVEDWTDNVRPAGENSCSGQSSRESHRVEPVAREVPRLE